MLFRNLEYDNKVMISNVTMSTTHRLTLPYKGEQVEKIIKSVNNYVKDYYQKIMHHNTYIKVEDWALLLI